MSDDEMLDGRVSLGADLPVGGTSRSLLTGFIAVHGVDVGLVCETDEMVDRKRRDVYEGSGGGGEERKRKGEMGERRRESGTKRRR